jgi:NDP-sugar pyrophosphorylase family protein
MNNELVNDYLAERLSDLFSPVPFVQVEPAVIDDFIKHIVCMIPCGGASKRMKEDTYKHKGALELPNGKTIIELTISSYAKWGIKNFVLLVGIHADSIYEAIEGLDIKGINISFSKDPREGVGRGGAVKYAIENGLINKNDNMLVHNSDDILLNYPGNFLYDVCKYHIQANSFGGVATAAVTDGTKFPFSCMYVKSGEVVSMLDSPIIPIPTHVGITVFNSAVQDKFVELFSYSKKQDFERVLFPRLANIGQLFAFKIPKNCWFPINNPKEYQNLIAIIKSNNAP